MGLARGTKPQCHTHSRLVVFGCARLRGKKSWCGVRYLRSARSLALRRGSLLTKGGCVSGYDPVCEWISVTCAPPALSHSKSVHLRRNREKWREQKPKRTEANQQVGGREKRRKSSKKLACQVGSNRLYVPCGSKREAEQGG